MKIEIKYYSHPESDCMWVSYKSLKEENTDGCVQELDRDEAVELAKILDFNLEEAEQKLINK